MKIEHRIGDVRNDAPLIWETLLENITYFDSEYQFAAQQMFDVNNVKPL